MQLLRTGRELFEQRFTDYHVADERVRLGFHPDNPVNLPSAHGVQVELPPGLRGIGDFGEILVPPTDGIVKEVVATLVELAAWATELMRTTSVGPPSELTSDQASRLEGRHAPSAGDRRPADQGS